MAWRYTILFGDQSYTVRASSARTAINRVLSYYTDANTNGVNIKFTGKQEIPRTFRVRCTNTDAEVYPYPVIYTQDVSKRSVAALELKRIRKEHPKWRLEIESEDMKERC